MSPRVKYVKWFYGIGVVNLQDTLSESNTANSATHRVFGENIPKNARGQENSSRQSKAREGLAPRRGCSTGALMAEEVDQSTG
jgi:hypothetical protein